MRCLILLLMIGNAYAQPEWYAVWSDPSRILDHQICVRGVTVDILFVNSDTSKYIAYNLDTTQPSDPIPLLSNPDYTHLFLIDMTPVSPEQWACLLHMNTRTGGYGQFFFNTKLLHGNSHETNSVEVESSNYSDFPNIHSGSWTEGHSLSFHDGRLAASYFVTSVTPFDVQYNIVYQEFSPDFERVIETGTEIYAFFNDYRNRAIAIPIATDSALIYSDIDFSGNQGMFIGPVSGFDDQQFYHNPICGDSRILRELKVTASNRIIATYIDNSLHQIVPTPDGGADCNLFAQLATNSFQSWAFHPNYGFAALQVIPGYLLLARIDTAGHEVHPPGVLYITDGTSFIADADVTISDSGEVIAVWSEYTDWNEGPHVLKIAWTEWATYLDTPEQQVPTIPREISLSSYPNPFNCTVTIKYDLPQAGHAKLTAYDLQGRVVATLFDDFAPARSMELHWSPENLASGVYFITLEAPLAHATHKILLLK